jgi:hypothetical protein
MADVEWRPLATLRPEPAVWTDVGELMLLMFTQDGVPTWEVSRRVKVGSSRDDLIANGAADIIERQNCGILRELDFFSLTRERA